MKKSKTIQLVLITAALASCNKKEADKEWNSGSKTYVRSDSTAPYYRTHFNPATALLWYYAFRPYGMMGGNGFQRGGYYSNAVPHAANVGTNAMKGNVTRGGFGRSGVRASS